MLFVVFGKNMIDFMLSIPFVKRYESCVGLSLPALGKWKIEFWFASSGYEIKPHTHPDLDIKLMFIFGHNTTFYRDRGAMRAQKLVKWWNIGKTFTILRGDSHHFTVSKWPLLFMNIERWYKKPTSAAESFYAR